MKTINWVFLIALTVIGAGCSASQPFEALTEEIAPVESAMAPEMASDAVAEEVAEEIAPAPSADIAEEGVETLQGPILKVDKAAISDYYRREFQRQAGPQYLAEDGETAVYHFGGADYFAQHPDIKIKVAEDDREEVEYVIHLTPDQKQELLQKRAGIALKKIPLEKLKCLLSDQGSADCED